MQAFSEWLVTTQLSMFVNDHSWVWPACETLHFMGLALLIGNVGLLDLRLLGVVRQLPAAPLGRFMRWAVLGFLVNLATGLMFLVGNPFQYITNIAFGYKVAFILLAGLNVAVFYATGVYRKVEALGPGDEAPLLA